jgi:glycosyltransferase involved in cell wall biosynthesis
MIRTLLFSTLYPSSVQPSHGIFVETRLRHLLASGQVETRVIAPVPWFPFKHKAFGEYATYAAVPRHEERNGLSVDHPRFLRLPKVGMTSAPYTLARAGLKAARKLIADGYDFDLIDAHYFYPDGVAAVMIGQALNKPVVITARGTDINLIPRYATPRRMILNAAKECGAVITVSVALKNELVKLGADPEKITVLRNGVDLDLFYPEDRAVARQTLGTGTIFMLASVGNLIPTKGHELAIEALASLPDVQLFIAGRGAGEGELKALAARLGVAERVRFLGTLPQDRLRTLYSAANGLVLASVREGWPNVLLEAMACGTPVVVSRVGGTPEIVALPEAGVILEERSAKGVVDGIRKLLASLPDRAATRRYAEGFGWDATTNGQIRIFQGVLADLNQQ